MPDRKISVSVPVYNIKEGHGRFEYTKTDDGIIVIFSVTDQYRTPGKYEEISEKLMPVFGFVVQSREKATAIAGIFMDVASNRWNMWDAEACKVDETEIMSPANMAAPSEVSE